METLLQQINDILTTPPGNLIVYLIIAFSILATFQTVLIGKRTSRYPYTSRLLLGLGVLLIAQLILFLSSGLAWQGVTNPHLFLPPLDRAIIVFNLVWIIWMWCFPEPNRPADILNGVVNLLIILSLAFSLAIWNIQQSSLSFNASWLNWAWTITIFVTSLVGIVLLSLRRPDDWGIGLGIMILNLLGCAIQLIWVGPSGDYSAPIRLAQLCSFPLLPVLAQRLYTPFQVEKPALLLPPLQERRRYSADSRAVFAWAQVAVQKDVKQTYYALTRALAQTMLSDLCFLVTAHSSPKELVIQGGYDLIREEELTGTILDQTQVPALMNAVVRGKPLIINASTNSSTDVKNLCSAIGLETAGNLLHVPLISGTKIWGGIFFLSAYSNRIWNSIDQDYLTATTETILEIILEKQQPEIEIVQTKEPSEQLIYLQDQIKQLYRENQNLQNALKETQAVAKDIPDVTALLAVQQESQETINNLQTENKRLRAIHGQAFGQSSDSNVNMEYLEGELRLTLEEVARLQNNLAEANLKILALQNNPSSQGKSVNEEREVINSIAQELRQPLASILGYTDLLLSESAGILGALQRKFLERVKASTERFRSLLDDLVQVTSLQHNPLEISTQPVDMNSVIDQAIAETSSQIREKNITLRVDMPEELPKIEADRDALQQIVVHLLQNADMVTPVEGTITLRARIEDSEPKSPCLLLQVTDTGGGIAPEDQPRVFARQYRAENPLIQGVGDTGVGLSIAKTLVEAHGGRIWVESKTGHSTTFSMLLPIHPKVTPSSPSPTDVTSTTPDPTESTAPTVEPIP
ncbi:MAG TPA: ATP-binding protein [Anaerolineaceae bacterium]|nr:ATP-binding protein [Anaerolineaceae bacterium]